jgi:S1-C subfamily serine protease
MIIMVLYLVAGCGRSKQASHEPAPAGRYGSEFPSRNATDELERITRSVKKIYCVSYYTTWQFRKDDKLTGYHIEKELYKKAAWGIVSTSETVFGTGTIIGYSGPRVSLLTCAHVVNSPDTLITFFESGEGDPTRYIRTFSVREKREIWAKELTTCGPFTVLASDDEADIAILGKKCESLADTVIPFPYPAGSARELGWGSFVYIFGYPLGTQMITKGLVSPAPKRPAGEFTVDALLNKGCSGGIILALRNGVPNFELVGMVKTVNSSREEFLRPATDQQRTPDWIPYKGDVYVGSSDNIQYGLNAVVTMESIAGFYSAHRGDLVLSGYNLDGFFLPPAR